MAKRTNRRDLIVQTAANLFIKHGYATTSVRQIAEAVGCTEAAMYYHFKDGKRALLQAVVEYQTPDFLGILENCRHATSLNQLILNFTRSMCSFCVMRERHVQWLISEYPKFNADERAIFHQKHLAFHQALVTQIARFVPDEEEANQLAWTLICASFGYRQIFVTLGLSHLTDFPIDKFTEKMAHYLAHEPKLATSGAFD